MTQKDGGYLMDPIPMELQATNQYNGGLSKGEHGRYCTFLP